MGLGKTASVLSALEPEHLPVLVVAPKRVAEHVWPAEQRKWRPDLSLAVAAGSPANRRAMLVSGCDVIVIGRDNLADAVGLPWRTIVLDESSGFKNRSTKRWRAAAKLAKEATYVWELTGTPSPNGLLDLWAQVALLDQGERLGKTLGSYRSRYFTESKWINGHVVDWAIRPGAAERIHALLGDICLSMESRLDLPPVTYNNVAVPLPPSLMAAYKRLKKELVADLDGASIVASNAAVATGKLSQLTAGFNYPHPDDLLGFTTDLHDEKTKALAEVIEGTGSPVLVFYRFKHELERLREIPGAVSIDEHGGVIQEWNAGTIPILLAHPASAGHGLNLQHGGHTIVWTTPTWNAEEYAQANARLARQGQTHPVVIHHLIAPDTVDGAILDRLAGKLSVQDALLKALR
jgi:SNF2 family DNA or RNA helicase